MQAVPRRHAVFWIFVASTAVGLYFATQAFFNPALQGMVKWQRALVVNLVYYYLWGLAVPLVVVIARRVQFSERRRVIPFAIHLAASGTLSAFIIVVAEAILRFIAGTRTSPFVQVVRYAFGVNFHSTVPTYWLILLAYLAFRYYASYRDREMRATQLEARLSEARLDALKMQLRPHFLFNTLNSISSLMYVDIEAADTMIRRLGDFLRLTIEGDRRNQIPLRQELEFVQRYLEIERIRFEERLRVEYDVATDLLNAMVPTLVLQPLVENAIHHGIGEREAGGHIAIRAALLSGRLHLTVEDDGPGVGTNGPERVRIGLGGTRARLEQTYGAEHEILFSHGRTGGLCVTVAFPYRAAEESA